MTKREEIREGIYNLVTYTFSFTKTEITNEILKFLDEKGVVIKVDRELPYKQKEIDVEILDLVNALNLGGVPTTGSCSGHGREHGYILLKDERTLIILPAPLDKDYVTRELQFNQSIKIKPR